MAGDLALCSGLVGYRMGPDAPSFPLGGVELVNLAEGVAIHQVPVQLWTDTGRVMTQNPFWAEANEEGGLTFYFIPEDDTSRLFIYDVTP